MTAADLVPGAAAPLLVTIRSLTAADLARPTPCADYDVGALLNHLLFWAPSLAGAARREPVPPPAADESAVDLVAGGDPVARLQAAVAAVADAWSDRAAWEGTVTMGGPPELPAATIGGMAVGELVVHGWDLARATGWDARFEAMTDPDAMDLLLQELAVNGALGRDMGLYGPEVAVPASAPALHRVLGLTGRDPAWTAAALRPSGSR